MLPLLPLPTGIVLQGAVAMCCRVCSSAHWLLHSETHRRRGSALARPDSGFTVLNNER
jgi:hypothetical protein